jgi:hypothetical protein
MKAFIHDCIAAFPPPYERIVQLAFFNIIDTFRNWKLPCHLVVGKISMESEKGSLVCFGELSQYRSWIAKFFVYYTTPTFLGHFRLFDIVRLRKKLSKYDIALCPANPATEVFFSNLGWLIIPRLIDCVIDLRKPLKEKFDSHNIKKQIRRLRNSDYTFKIFNSELALKEFYDEMLIPTVKRRHQELAFVSRFEDLKEKLKNGYLLAVYRNSKWVAADLVVREGNKILRAANTGWRNGDISLLKHRVNDALTFELINRAKNEGFAFLNLGNCLPFIDDGVFKFKLKWKADPVLPEADFKRGKIQRAKGFLALRFNLASQSGQAFLHCNPLFEKHKGIIRAVGWNSPPRPHLRRLLDEGLPWVDICKL